MTRPADPPRDVRALLAATLVKLDRMQARIDALEAAPHQPIAILGMACRFPGAIDTPEQFWERLCAGHDSVTRVPADRWDADAFFDPDPAAPGRMTTRHGAFLRDIDALDARFFAISRRELAALDPQQRLLLEVAWHAFEDARLPATRLRDTPVGVFVGLCGADHAMAMYRLGPAHIDAFHGRGNAASVAAGRLSFFFGLTGPALTIDTACSSSLVAVHQACESLRRGECQAALVAAANVILEPGITVALAKAGMMAPDGRCKTFDARADGYVRGEGCAAVVLKRLADAVRDGDRICAVIRGSAINQDGASGGLTMPSGPAQQRLLRAALAQARLRPEQIDYVETHGTGTPLGDPIECNALGEVFCSPQRAGPLVIGSVKTNLGHLETAAGLAGLIKTVLALQHAQIPAHLHFERPSPHIAWDALRLQVPRRLEPWPTRADGPRRAGVSAFGFSGTNAHVLLEQAPPVPPPDVATDDTPQALLLAAHSEPALRALADRHHAQLVRHPALPLAALCRATARGRAALPERLAVVAASRAELLQRLAAFADPERPPEPTAAPTDRELPQRGRVRDASPRGLALVLGGAAPPDPALVRHLDAHEPAYRDALAACEDWLRPHGVALRPLVLDDPPAGGHPPAHRLPASFALAYAEALLWRARGVTPAVLIGVGVGVHAAACVVDLLALPDALTRTLAAVRDPAPHLATPPLDTPPLDTPPLARTANFPVVRADTSLAALDIARAHGCRTVLQLGARPDPDIGPAAAAHELRWLSAADTAPARAVPTLLGALFVLGVEFDPIAAFPGRVDAIDLPLYPFQRETLRGWPRPEAPGRASPAPIVLLESPLDMQPTSTAPTRDDLAATHRAAIRTQLRDLLAGLLREPPEALRPDDTFFEQGADSIILTDLAHQIGQRFGVDVEMTRLFEELQSLDQLAAHIAEHVPPPAAPPATDPHAAPHRPATTDPHVPPPRLVQSTDTASASQRPDAPHPHAAAGPSLSALADELRTAAPVPDDLPAYHRAVAALPGLVGVYVLRALRDLGAPLHPGAQVPALALAELAALAPRYRPLLPRLVHTLEVAGLLRRDGAAITVTTAPEIDPDAALLELAAQVPSAAAELELLARAGARLGAMLRGQQHPLTVLFPRGNTADAAAVYGAAPVARLMNTLLAEAVARLVRPGARLLEVGAGTGGTTRSLLAHPALAGVDLCISELSPFLLDQARRSFTGRPALDFRALDLERDPLAQGFAAGSFDVIVAANVLHATADLRATLEHLRRLLCPGGHLVVLETVEHAPWLDITFGLTEGWWRFTDAPLRRDSPLLGSAAWCALLEQSGFTATASLARRGLHTVTGQDLILARLDPAAAPWQPARLDPAAAPWQPARPDPAAPPWQPARPDPATGDRLALPGGLESVLMAQLQALQDLRALHETTMTRQLDLLRGAGPTTITPANAATLATPSHPPLAPLSHASLASPATRAPAPTNLASATPAPATLASATPAPANLASAIPSPATQPPPRAQRLDTVIGANPRAITLTERRPLSDAQRGFIRDLARRYNHKTARSRAYAQAGRGVLSDWINTIDFRLAIKELQYPIVSEWSQGAKFRDIDGNTYVDLAMGFGANFFGHNPPFVVDAIREQLAAGMELATQSPLASEVAGLIHELTGVERVAFSNTGTEAIMHAVRIARARTGRRKIAVFAGSYHGTFDGILAATDASGAHTFPGSTGTPQGMVDDVVVLTYGSEAALARVRELAGELAAVLVEPVQSRQPALQPRAFLHALRALTRAHDVALIFDEMITGFRIAPGGAQQWFDVRADLVAYGKAVGGGMPISVLAGDAAYMDLIDGGPWQFGDDSYPRAGMTTFGGTFCRHPLALAACRAVLLHLRAEGPALQERTRRRGDALAAALGRAFDELGVPMRLANFGPLLRFESHGPYSMVLQPIELPLFYCLLNLHGVYTWERRVSFLSTCHDDADLEQVVRAARESIAELLAHGFFAQGGARGPGQPGSRERSSAAGPPGPPGLAAASPSPSLAPDLPASPAPDLPASPAPDLTASPAPDLTPTSENQRQLWILAELDPHASAAFNVSASLRLRGPLDVDDLEAGARAILARHEALRTRIVAHGEAQEPVASPPFVLVRHDLSADPRPERRALALREALCRAPFELDRAPLFAVHLLRLAADEHILTVKTHHVVADGWSIELILRELAALYSAARRGQPAELAEPWPFRSYLAARARRDDTEHQSYWLAAFAEPPPDLELPLDAPRPARKSFSGARSARRLDPGLHARLRAHARRHGATLFMAAFAAYTVLLARLTGQSDLVVGVPVLGRDDPREKLTVGFCSQLLPVRVQVDLAGRFADHVAATRRTLLAAFRHQRFTYADLLAARERSGAPGRAPGLRVTFNMDPQLAVPEFAGATAELLEEPLGYTSFDLGFNLIDLDGELIVYCNYNADLLLPATVAAFLDYFAALLHAAAADDPAALADLPLAAPAALVGPTLALDDRQTIAHHVRAQADRSPDRTAVVAGPARLSYRELERASDRLAVHLRDQHGVRPGDPVAMLLARHEGVPVTALALFKLGAVYVPLDPAHPQARLAALLADSDSRVCVSESSLVERLPPGLACARWDALAPALTAPGDPPPLALAPPGPVAYLFYTSGSTGRPKGVMGRHESVVHVLHDLRQRFGLAGRPGWKYLFTAAVTHDPSLRHIFLPLISGGEVHVHDAADPRALLAYVQDQAIDAIHTTPTIYRELVRELGEATLAGPGYVSIGGERLDHATAALLRRHFPGAQISNVYGATETCVGVAHSRLDAAPHSPASAAPHSPLDATHSPASAAPHSPLDAPRSPLDAASSDDPPLTEAFANHELLLLDPRGRPVPPHAHGEICVAGPGLAAGYHRQPELSAERFIPHPTRPGLRLYRTGDRGRFDADGRLHFAGRLDGQLKLRGHRIEPGEVEAALLGFPAVEQAAVALRPLAGRDTLVAWLVLTPSAPRTPAELATALREHLRRRLPAHMLPAAVVRQDQFPRTPHGKLDRQALPDPARGDVAGRERVAPRDATEARLLQIWQAMLEHDAIGVLDDFFAIGGHSLHASRVVSRVHRELGATIKLADFFADPTIAGLARLLRGRADDPRGDAYRPIPRAPAAAHDPVSNAQRRLWVLEQMDVHGLAYAMPSAYLFTGPLDPAAFAAAFADLVARHEVLRTRFVVVDDEPRQVIAPALDLHVERHDLQRYPDPGAVARELALRDATTRFDLQRGPLLRVHLLALGPDRHVVLFNAHHIIFDGWSAGVLIRDFLGAYAARCAGRAPELAPLPIQYRDYTAWQRQRLHSGALAGQRAYWLAQLASPPAPLDLPGARPRPPLQSFRGGKVDLRADGELVAPLLALCRAGNASLFMGLVALVKAQLLRLTGRRDLVVGAPIAGRNHPDLERQIGFYVNMLALRDRLADDESFASLLGRVRQTTTAAYDNQDYPFDALLEDLALRRDPGRTPLFDVVVALQNTEDVPLSLPGVVIAPFPQPTLASKFDLRFNFIPDGDALIYELEYSADLFDPSRVAELAHGLKALWRAVLRDPDAPLHALPGLAGAAPPPPEGPRLFDVEFSF